MRDETRLLIKMPRWLQKMAVEESKKMPNCPRMVSGSAGHFFKQLALRYCQEQGIEVPDE